MFPEVATTFFDAHFTGMYELVGDFLKQDRHLVFRVVVPSNSLHDVYVVHQRRKGLDDCSRRGSIYRLNKPVELLQKLNVVLLQILFEQVELGCINNDKNHFKAEQNNKKQ